VRTDGPEALADARLATDAGSTHLARGVVVPARGQLSGWWMMQCGKGEVDAAVIIRGRLLHLRRQPHACTQSQGHSLTCKHCQTSTTTVMMPPGDERGLRAGNAQQGVCATDGRKWVATPSV